MHQIDSAICDKLHSACLRIELRPKVAHVKGSLQVKIWLGHWSLEFLYFKTQLFFDNLFDFFNIIVSYNAIVDLYMLRKDTLQFGNSQNHHMMVAKG